MPGLSRIIPPNGEATGALLRSRLPRQRRRCGAGHRRVLRGDRLRFGAAALGRAPHGRHHLSPHLTLNDGFDARSEPDLQQPHPRRSGTGRRRGDHQDLLADQRDQGAAGALHDHREQPASARPLYDIGIVDRFPAGFKYVKGSARLDGEAARAAGQRPGTGLGRPRAAGQRQAHPPAAAGRRRRRLRRGIRQPGAGAQHRHRRERLRRGHRDRPGHPGPDLRLHRRDRQGVRRPQPERTAGRGRRGAGRGARW